MANEVTVASAPNAGVTEPNIKGANTPATAASPRPIPNAAAETRSTSMPLATAAARLVAPRHHRAGEGAEPGAVQIEIDQCDGDQAGDRRNHPRRGKPVAED